jgi:hypothetical protein
MAELPVSSMHEARRPSTVTAIDVRVEARRLGSVTEAAAGACRVVAARPPRQHREKTSAVDTLIGIRP